MKRSSAFSLLRLCLILLCGTPIMAMAELCAPSCRPHFTVCFQQLYLSKVELQDVPLEQAIKYIRIQSRENDVATTDPAKRGVNIILSSRLTPGERSQHITLTLGRTPFHDALRLLALTAGLKMRVDKYAVFIYSPQEVEPQKTEIFLVPPDFLRLAKH